eukprot:scaffold16550_cov21-Tisochrysis_lutea.AAC.2
MFSYAAGLHILHTVLAGSDKDSEAGSDMSAGGHGQRGADRDHVWSHGYAHPGTQTQRFVAAESAVLERVGGQGLCAEARA